MRRHLGLAGLLALHASLLFPKLGLLPVWTDESFTVDTVARPMVEIARIVGQDVHPPLYFMLLRGWNRLLLPWHGVARLRAFSAVWALAATSLLGVLAVRTVGRWLALWLFVLSPCFLLYGRMARSYSMQAALTLLAVGLLWRWIGTRSTRFAIWGCLAVLAVLWTHYVPGIALLAGFFVAAWRPLGVRRLAVFAAAVVAGYFPWLVALASALGRWGRPSGSSLYALTGNLVVEHLLKAGYAVVSMTVGESFGWGSLVLVPVLVGLALRGARQASRPFLVLSMVAGIVGYAGVSRWVSFPFTPARLLWLLPGVCVALGSGIALIRRSALRWSAILAVLLSYGSSVTFYFSRQNYLNPGYTVPLDEIAAGINERSTPRDLVLLDAFNTDGSIRRLFSDRVPVVALDPAGVAEIRSGFARAQTVWIVRNTHDVSPGHITTALESEACAGRERREELYQPYAAWMRHVMQWAPLPRLTHFYQVTVCRGASGS